MATPSSLELILRYDIASNTISMLTPDENGSPRALDVFPTFDVNASPSSLELANQVGAAVVAFFDARHPQGIIRVDELSLIEEDSMETTLDQVRKLIGLLTESSTESDLQAIDVLLKAGAAKGEEDAASYLRDKWPGLREVFARRISRGRPSK